MNEPRDPKQRGQDEAGDLDPFRPPSRESGSPQQPPLPTRARLVLIAANLVVVAPLIFYLRQFWIAASCGRDDPYKYCAVGMMMAQG